MGASPDWTAQGELLGKHLGGNATSYASDSLGRLQSVTLSTGHVVSYVYDGSNRRVGKKVDGALVQGFLYRDAIKPVVELDGSGAVVSRFVYGTNPLVPDYVIKGGSTYKIFSDPIGSPRVVVDVSSGSVVERIDYDERGNTLKDTNAGLIPFGFAGGIVDRDTGLIRYGVRDYDPVTGRWTHNDAVGFHGGLNFYAYADGDAINRVDPSGHDPLVLIGAVVGASADLAWQLSGNGGNFSCVDWGEVAGAGLVGAAFGLIGPAALEGGFWEGLVANETGALGEGAGASSGLGDLTAGEVDQIQGVVDQAQRPLDVVGSAADGARTAASDIDYTTASANHQEFDGLESDLPGIDSHGLLRGPADPTIGPSIRFEPGELPRYIPGSR